MNISGANHVLQDSDPSLWALKKAFFLQNGPVFPGAVLQVGTREADTRPGCWGKTGVKQPPCYSSHRVSKECGA